MRTMYKSLLCMLFLVNWSILGAEPHEAMDNPAGTGDRALFQRYVDVLTSGTGIWIASNEDYRSDQDPFDAYKLTWRKGIGGKSAYGRMTGLSGSDESDAIWEIRLYWHSAHGQARVMQFSSAGEFVDGPIEVFHGADSKGLEALQTFYPPKGTPFRVRQIIDFDDEEQRVSSYSENDGGWSPNRVYNWHRQRALANN